MVLFFVFYFFNSPTIISTKFYVQNGSEVVWSNKTVKWTYKYLIFAVDGGSPKRGDSISVTITFDVSCESTGAIVADPVTGDVFFRAPGLTGSIYRKTLASYNAFKCNLKELTTKSARVPRSAVFGMCMPGGWLHRSCDSLARSVLPSCRVLAAIFTHYLTIPLL